MTASIASITVDRWTAAIHALLGMSQRRYVSSHDVDVPVAS